MKKIITSLIILALLVFPINVKAAPVINVAVYLDETLSPSTYIIYPSPSSGVCSWATSLTPVMPLPIEFDDCDADLAGNPAVLIEEAVRAANPYLWFEGNPIPFRLEIDGYYDKALKSSEVDEIKNEIPGIGVMDRIDVLHGDRIITVNDTKLTNYQYALVKVTGSALEQFVAATANLKYLDDDTDPYDAVITMQSFRDGYKALFPAEGDSIWKSFDGVADNDAVNKIIHEPLDTLHDWTYIVWLKGMDGRTMVHDMQIMYCFRAEGGDTSVSVLPKTGIDYFLDGLLVVNGCLLVAIYLKRRKLVKAK